MDDIEDIIKKLVHIARIGSTGDAEKVKIQSMRLIRSLKKDKDPLADLLQDAMFSDRDMSNDHLDVIRRTRRYEEGVASPTPVDGDTGADLLKVEEPVYLEHDLIVDESIAAQLERIVRERLNVKKLASFNLQPTSTLLFTGPPGVGKTMAARKIASQLGLPLLTLDLATVISSFLGKTGNNLKSCFEFARHRRCVLLLDELDSIAKRRDDQFDIGEMKRLVTVILQELDSWPSDNLLIAATNHSSLLDPAVTRRFDQMVSFPSPSVGELIRLGRALGRADKTFPTRWARAIAVILEGSSQSDYVREINRLRKALIIDGSEIVEDVLATLCKQKLADADRSRRKEVAVMLVTEAKLSRRAAHRITGVARDTLKSAIEEVD